MLDVLSRWNRWGQAKLLGGKKRQIIDFLHPYFETPEVIALIGPRRAGKTTVLFQLMDTLETAGVSPKAMLHMNFEEPALYPDLNIKLLDKLYQSYRENIFPEGKAYLFFDEVQNIPEWERWIRARNESENIKCFITGSSSRLMSRELGSLLTGRHLSFNILPLNFQEFLRFKNKNSPDKFQQKSPSPLLRNLLKEYLTWGGFPEVVLSENTDRKQLLLHQYFDDILFKDVVIRHHIRDAVTLKNLAIFLLTHTASLVSFQRISKMFGVSAELAQSYCYYLKEAFLIDFLPFYSTKTSERNRHPQKVHAMDLGLRNALSFTQSEDRGRGMETAVYHALYPKSHDNIFYWKQKNEIDFLTRHGLHVDKLIQVVDILNQHTAEREFAALDEAAEKFPSADKMLIYNQLDEEIISTQKNNIKNINLIEFLLG